jgi:Putative transposase
MVHTHVNGFDLHAAVVVPARDRARLERTCRYALRPPVAHDRIRLTAEGQVLLTLRHRWADGTRHLLFDPIELLERLAALTPRPRINLVLYYGVLGAHAAWRARLSVPVTTEPAKEPAAERDNRSGEPGSAATSSTQPRSNLLWAQLMQRSFGFEVLACPRCGGPVPARRTD